MGANVLGLAVVALLLCLSRAHAYEQGPRWTIGHGQVIARVVSPGGRPALYLRVSLRNMGPPGRLPVTVYGRWQTVSRASTRSPGGQISWRPNPNHPAMAATHRWQMPSPAAGTPYQATPGVRIAPGMRMLGRYRREVSLVSTAILEIPLQVLGPPRADARGLELEIMTAAKLTGKGYVPIYTN